ncbi:MAG: hypothetical protein EA387_15885 [Nitriliruptor sp.]|nr:MAG: hypothetical protein EA387_15885 [Nitriliruptor sp.]
MGATGWRSTPSAWTPHASTVAAGSAAGPWRPVTRARLRTTSPLLAEWRGDALQDVDAPWAAVEAQLLEEHRLSTIEDRCEAELTLGRHRSVVPDLERLAATHPLRERLQGLLLRALAGAGRQADALTAYDRVRSRLAEELGMDPSAELQRIHTEVLTQRHEPTPAPHPPVRATTLPVPASSFVGRRSELERVAELLRTERIVTITGPGGAGKTRLAIEASRSLEAAGDGEVAAFVELGNVVDPAAVPAVAAAALGIRGQAGTPLTEVIAGALCGRETRLVVDNCEHLLDAVAELVDHVTVRCPRVRLLATSREPLGLAGEVVWPLDTLPVPPADTGDLATAAAAPAVELLLSRVAAAAPELQPTEGDTAAIVRIVRELDGLPLAIELAAARTRVMSLAEIAERLSDRFVLLAGGRRGSPARHQALASTLEWSWDLLAEGERRAWMIASVPVGPFTTELLAALCAAVDPPLDPLEVVAALTDRSLLRVAVRGNPSRYEMLSTIREFGQQQLAASELEPAVRAAHAAAAHTAVAALDRCSVEAWDVDLDGQRDWLPDVRAALRWHAARGERRQMQRLAARLGWLYYLTALSGEGLRLLDAALGPLADLEPPDVEPDAVLWAAGLRIGEPAVNGLAWAELAASLADGPVRRTLAHGFLAAHRVLSGDLEGTMALIQREAAIGGWLEGLWRSLEGKLLTILGQLDAAESALLLAEELLTEGGSWTSMLAGDTLVQLALLRGDIDAVRRAAQRGIRTCIDHRSPDLETELRCLLAMAEAAVDEHARAAVELDRARELADHGGPVMAEAIVAQAEAYALARRGDVPAARERWREALSLHHWTGFACGRPFGLWGLGHLALQDGDPVEAGQLLSESLAVALERHDQDAIAAALEGLAAVEVATGQAERAVELLGAAQRRREQMGAPAPLLNREYAAATWEQVRDALGAPRFAAGLEAGGTLEVSRLVAAPSAQQRPVRP